MLYMDALLLCGNSTSDLLPYADFQFDKNVCVDEKMITSHDAEAG